MTNSPLITREQRYAEMIYQQIVRVATLDETARNRYGAMAHKLPVLIRTAGLTQALAFVASRSQPEPLALLRDLEHTINVPDLAAESRRAPLAEYISLTHRTLEALLWYKRFTQSVLDIHSAQAAEEYDAGGTP